MRRMFHVKLKVSFIIVIMAFLNAHSVDCIRPLFDYFATNFENNALLMPSEMFPDSIYQEQNGRVNTIKYHWTGNHLDSMSLYQSCHARGYEKKSTFIPDWKIDSTKVGKVKKYDWKSLKDGWHFTVYRGKDSVYIDNDNEQHQIFYLKNDTIHEVDNWIPRNWIIFRDPNDESKCIRKSEKNLLIDTYEYEMKGNTLIQNSIKFDYTRYIKAPGPCMGGNEYTTIYYRK